MELLSGLPLVCFRCVSAEWEALFSRGFKGVGLADAYGYVEMRQVAMRNKKGAHMDANVGDLNSH